MIARSFVHLWRPDWSLWPARWLFGGLAEQLGGHSEDWETLTQDGSLVITSSPAGLYPVVPGDHVLVRCCGMEVSCTVVDGVKSPPAKL